MEILRNKNLATRFQVLVEIAQSGPNVQQRGIAKKVGVSPQAISDHVGQLVTEGLLVSDGRASYKVTSKGTNWIIKVLRELRDYTGLIEKAVTNISVCAAVAGSDIVKDQLVGLKMKDGLLFATDNPNEGARGIAFSDARKSEDIGVASIEGIVTLSKGKVTILSVPTVDKGGTKQVNLRRLNTELGRHQQIGAIGIEALIALQKSGTKPRYIYGVVDASIEAAKCGLSFLIVCTSDATHSVLSRLKDDGLDCEFLDAAIKAKEFPPLTPP
ncbi:MAG: Crp/Fnr family transcriptional regulator [Dehalococcoidales bacterium]|jgi:putative transcriptional regulator|nr:Crp/Fnr family transcriptional regulator [Dehalococcoidales bacterium]MDP6576311.1 MarR family transcriptional regulator [Dehalococcoidales bacterium]MDP6824512.1 MarR family transcriptional regulator [Dehalococcoidales bacterium]|tara:strand:- start:2754 stop:3566 length:813 start_codon:yes stop_codon:yes gene_type:complete